MEMEHSSALIRAFVTPDRQERYLALLASPRGRAKLREKLAHLHDLDPKCCRELPKGIHTPHQIQTVLESKGAPAECVLLAEDAELDGQRLPLGETLEAIIGRGMGTLISCIPGSACFLRGRGYRCALPSRTGSLRCRWSGQACVCSRSCGVSGLTDAPPKHQFKGA